MTIKNNLVITGLLTTALQISPLFANETGYSLPLELAIEAANGAIQYCEKSNYHISVAVVDLSGEIKVQLKGDNSTIHTKDTSFRKAYTLVTLGPVFNLDTSSQVADLMKNNPNRAAFLTVPGITPLPGAVAIKANNRLVATLGVGGAPGGAKDEECAKAGVMKIADKLPK